MNRALLSLIVLLLLLGSPLATTAQVIDEKDDGTKLGITKDEGTRLRITKDDDDPPKKKSVKKPVVRLGSEFLIQARSRWLFIPDAILSRFFSTHPTYNSFSVAMEVIWRRLGKYDLVFSLDYSNLTFPDANWMKKSSTVSNVPLPYRDADYTKVNLHFISIDATFVWPVNIGRYVQFFGGVGLGVGVLVGSVRTIDVLPTCSAPVSKCQHWRGVTSKKRKIPSPVWPVVNALIGFKFRYKQFNFRIETGIRNVFFLGAALGYKL